MADQHEEPCGSKEKTLFLNKYDDVNGFVQQTLRSVLQATKCSNEMPAAGDDFDFYSSYSGFQDAMNIEGKRLLHMIQSVLKHQNVKINLDTTGGGAAEIDDKFDLLMDGNDQILERVGQWLDEASGLKKQDDTLIVASATPKQFTTASWNKKSPGASGSPSSFRLLSARNIQRPQLKFKEKVDNRRLPFRPPIKHKYNAKRALEESLQLPHGVTAEMTEDQSFVYPHPYKYELENIEYPAEQLALIEPCTPGSLEETPCIYVETEEQLAKLVTDLKQHKEIAVDLEHHNFRSFQGFTCLMQISTRNTDYLIDTLALRSELHIVNEVFTDPTVVKVLHGSDHDIGWLMRDLGVYIVNMFDTGQAGRVMNFPRLSLAHLLQHYCNVTADKQYQLADWRIRPLPEQLLKYAREDTHYLLYIYDKMKNELIDRGNQNKNLLMSVLQKSTDICSKVYKKPIFTEDSHRDVFHKKKRMFNSQQMQALQDLYAWRDQTARLEDESLGFVLPNHMLVQICDILPRESQGILACCNPIPPLVRQYLPEMHSIIMRAREVPLQSYDKATTPKTKKPSSYQHPKYNVDSLLNCPHDLSHLHKEMVDDQLTTLLDSSLISQQSSVYPELSETSDDIIVVKQHPLLSVFDHSRLTCSTMERSKVKEILSDFSSPYVQFLPDEDQSIIKTGKMNNKMSVVIENWKLKPVSNKRKDCNAKEMETPPITTGPPTKRSKTDLHSQANSHVRFDSDGSEDETTEKYEKTEDDKKALPQDLEIPLRFQLPSKKKKKNRNRDADIMDAVQKHLSNIRKLQEENDLALGQNEGDEQPIEPKEQIKVKKDKKQGNGKMTEKDTKSSQGKTTDMEKSSQEKTTDKEKSSQGKPIGNEKSSNEQAITIDDSDSDEVMEVKVEERKEIGKKKNENDENGGKRKFEKKTEKQTDAIVIGDSDDETPNKEKKAFKPYDYSAGTKQLFEGDKTETKKEYFNPMNQMKGQKGPKGGKNKGHMKSGSKSYTYRR